MKPSNGPSAGERAVLERIRAEELVELTQRLVAARGENPPGQEAATVTELVAAARERGFAGELSEVEPGRDNVDVTLDAGDGPGLLLLGHTDVVPVGDGWTVDPFGGAVRDGRIYGRGTTDMKGGLAACLVAMTALRDAGLPLAGPVQLAAVVDEEAADIGIQHWTRRLGERRAGGELPAYRGCVVAEPTDLQTIIAARGASYLEIRVTGQAAHAGNPADGRSAIYGAARIVSELERWHEQYAGDRHPLVGARTWNVGTIHGGTGGSIVPAECRITVDRRLLPGESPTEVLAETRARLDRLGLADRGLGLEVEMTMDMPGFETAAGHEFVRCVDGALGGVGGPGLPLGGWTAACDGGYVARDHGVPTVVLGPGSVAEQAHRADESVGIEELVVAARAYALTALRLLAPAS
ncbi:MAG TPA: M20 family metallopeptidase [Segeticoccus sp.]|uniref:M20 family metallopeptidase n=1 Tax=Segeticoccus sp. TaxID=2706531 RepID=UPI002D80C91A|nr:M20 family metallopeptidase [Segeticoccus sp.]HET8601990.1 M20 family metallopeptidase [Segeticoccus sp.]